MQYNAAISSVDELKTLTRLLRKNGFDVMKGLPEYYRKKKIVGICIDPDKKSVSRVNSMIMACLCSVKRNPVYYEDIMDNYDRLIKEKNFGYYLEIIEKRRNAKNA